MVLRRRLAFPSRAGGLVGSLVGIALFEGRWSILFELSALALLWLAYVALVEVSIDRDAVRVRTLTRPFGRRILRQSILEVREVPGPGVSREPRSRRVVLHTTNGTVVLPAPLLGIEHWDNDPEYFRKLIWLHHELTPLPPPPTLTDHDTVERGPGVSAASGDEADVRG